MNPTHETAGFAVEGLHGVVSERVCRERLGAALGRLIDPGAATRTLHWGRNYLYITELETGGGTVPVVVKQFPGGVKAGLRSRLKGTKAEQSWAAAEALAAAGVDTPEPLARIDSDDPSSPSWYVSRLLPEATEARYLLRAANRGAAAHDFPQFPLAEFLDRLARLARRLHENRIWFRDLTSGNVLLSRNGAGTLALTLVDLNRARIGRRLTLSERTRDLSRMPILRPADQERLLRVYWSDHPDGRPSLWGLKRGLYLLYHHGFLLKNRAKALLRRGRARLAGKILARGTHAHIPQAPHAAASREKVVWDHLSDQPHLHASPLAKLGMRLGDARAHLTESGAALGAVPRILRRYRELRRELYREPTPFTGAGVALRPWPEDPAALLELVAALDGAGRPVPVLVRLHPWDPTGYDAEEALAGELASRGHEVSFAVPQNRELVKDRERWRRAMAEIAERLTPHGRSFQIGQAINRAKWGVWTIEEYGRLVADAADALRRARPDVEILGPAVIDFEPHVTAAAVNLRRPGLRFDAVSSLLYVDRRGAPENTQGGFDSVGKVALIRAIADTGRRSASRAWITEVNWPLREGPHSPAGRSVAVDEESQADYLARYYLLTLGTGLVERVFWWQMIARGYGLVCPGPAGALRRRPAFRALATLRRLLDGATFLGPLPAGPPARLYRFQHPDGSEVVAGWTTASDPAPPTEGVLPRPASAVTGRDGQDKPVPHGERILLGPSPRYFHLA